jgi:maltose O-acetyltransferase
MISKKLLKLVAKQLPGCGLRIRLLRRCGYRIGESVYIGEDLIIVDDLDDRETPLVIGDRAAISPRVTLVLHSQPNQSRIVPYVNWCKGAITIGADAWIGTGAVILPDVTVGEGAVVGANAVVTRSVDPYTIVAGIPARVVKRIKVPWNQSSAAERQGVVV